MLSNTRAEGSSHLLASGSEQNEVLRVVSIPTGILLYCPQSSRAFFFAG